jgi:FtsZ-binding cell division protein ZapB
MKFLILFFIPILLFSEDINKLDKKINYNKNILQLKEKQKNKTSKKIEDLAKTITEEERILEQLESKLETVSNTIVLNKLKLSRAKKAIEKLSRESSNLQNNIENIEEKLVNKVIDKYTLTLSKEMIDKKSLDEIINEEKFKLLFEDTKDTILKSNLTYFKLSNEQTNKNKKRVELEKYIQFQEDEKEKFLELKIDQEKSIDKLKK